MTVRDWVELAWKLLAMGTMLVIVKMVSEIHQALMRTRLELQAPLEREWKRIEEQYDLAKYNYTPGRSMEGSLNWDNWEDAKKLREEFLRAHPQFAARVADPAYSRSAPGAGSGEIR